MKEEERLAGFEDASLSHIMRLAAAAVEVRQWLFLLTSALTETNEEIVRLRRLYRDKNKENPDNCLSKGFFESQEKLCNILRLVREGMKHD